MLIVSVIEGKVRLCFERSNFPHYWYDEAEVANNRFLVRVQYTYASSLVVVPCGEKFGGKMFVRAACHVVNKG